MIGPQPDEVKPTFGLRQQAADDDGVSGAPYRFFFFWA
jgi:hypothetical protein